MSDIDWMTFNYWAPEHFEVQRVTGSMDDCMAAFHKEKEKYPTMQYATTISEKGVGSSDNDSYVVIRRFKTKKLCRIHHDFPPTYVREGQVL